MLKKITSLVVLSFFLTACVGKTTPSTPTPTQPPKKPKATQIIFEQKPQISLIPRNDGHELKLKIDNIPTSVIKLDYELIYKAKDGNLEIDKGLADNVNEIKPNIERDLLLGTKSCTSGCKYKYDTGVNSGSLKITFLTDKNEVSTYESNWNLNQTRKGFVLSIDDYEKKPQTFNSN